MKALTLAVILGLAHESLSSPGDKYILTLPAKRLKVCDNMIVNDIPGGPAAVLEAGRLYLESMHNLTITPLEAFKGAWKCQSFCFSSSLR